MKHLSTSPLSSTNSKQNKHLEIHTQIHHSQAVEIKTEERERKKIIFRLAITSLRLASYLDEINSEHIAKYSKFSNIYPKHYILSSSVMSLY